MTALFADLVSSTELAARLDLEELSGVVRPFLLAMTEEIEAYGGTIEKYAGDGVIAVFGAPVAHEDDPERAVRAASQCRIGSPRYRPTSPPSPGSARDADRHRDGRGRRRARPRGRGLLTGSALHVAARLQSAAAPGTIVVGERAWRDTRDAIAYRPLDDVELRGLEGPSRIWRATGLRAVRREGIAASVPLVGRRERALPARPPARPHRPRAARTADHRPRPGGDRQEPPRTRVRDRGPRAAPGAEARRRTLSPVWQRARVLAARRDPQVGGGDPRQRPGGGHPRQGARQPRRNLGHGQRGRRRTTRDPGGASASSATKASRRAQRSPGGGSSARGGRTSTRSRTSGRCSS